MAILEEVPEDSQHQKRSMSKTELLSTLRALSSKLSLTEDLLPAFMADDEDFLLAERYRLNAHSVLKEINELQSELSWEELGLEDKGEIWSTITRLYGEDIYTSTEIIKQIDELSHGVNKPKLAIHLLAHTLRPLFSASHPMLNPSTSRALPRPAGGPEAMSDLQNDAAQIWKSPSAWGHYNILSWCCLQTPTSELPDRIGLILPPTLMMMDDWDEAWRGRGALVLGKWISRIEKGLMKRMGMDTLLLKSLIHTLSLHPKRPLERMMGITLELVERTSEGEKRAGLLAEIMEKAVLSGWMYAPNGKEGRVVLIQIAKQLEQLCEVMKEGVLRWMKTIIPNLMQPLVYPPTSAVLPHFEANLSALICVLRCTASTGRVPRWRGQIIDILARLCVQLDEKEKEEIAVSNFDQGSGMYTHLRSQIEAVFTLLQDLCPTVASNEFKQLLKIDHSVFESFIPPKIGIPA